jgi:hypothetical protein
MAHLLFPIAVHLELAVAAQYSKLPIPRYQALDEKCETDALARCAFCGNDMAGECASN